MRVREAKSRRLAREDIADPDLCELPDGTRWFFHALSLYADDGGYLYWDLAQLGAELYRFRPRKARERDVEAHAARLVAARLLDMFGCPLGHARLHLDRSGRGRGRTGQEEHLVEEEHRRCLPLIASTKVNSSQLDETRPPIRSVPFRSKPSRTPARPDGAGGGFTDDEKALGASLAQKETNR